MDLKVRLVFHVVNLLTYAAESASDHEVLYAARAALNQQQAKIITVSVSEFNQFLDRLSGAGRTAEASAVPIRNDLASYLALLEPDSPSSTASFPILHTPQITPPKRGSGQGLEAHVAGNGQKSDGASYERLGPLRLQAQ